MKNTAFRISAILLMSGTLAGCSGTDDNGTGPLPGDTVVSMPGNSFSPFSVTIRVNDAVSWDFPSEEHDVVFTPKAGAPANIPVTSRAVVTRKFPAVGVFPYDCKVHPGMSGQVTVTN